MMDFFPKIERNCDSLITQPYWQKGEYTVVTLGFKKNVSFILWLLMFTEVRMPYICEAVKLNK